MENNEHLDQFLSSLRDIPNFPATTDDRILFSYDNIHLDGRSPIFELLRKVLPKTKNTFHLLTHDKFIDSRLN